MIPTFLTSCMIHEPARSYCTKRWQISANVAQTAKKRQCLMQVGEPGAKSKLSLSVTNVCDRPPRICRLVTCSSCCSAPTSKTLMVDLYSDVLRIVDFPVVHEFAHVQKPSKL